MVSKKIVLGTYIANKAFGREVLDILQRLGYCMNTAMNTFVPHGVQYPLNILAGQSYYSQPVQPFGIQATNCISVPNLSLPVNAIIQQQQQTQEINKILQLGLLQHQFIQNFAFTNCGNYHPHVVPKASFHQKSKSTPNICDEIKDEILKHLQPGVASSIASSSCGSPESLSDDDEQLDFEDSDDTEDMNRGVKRPLNAGPGRQQPWPPLQKRARSEERDQGPIRPPWGEITEFRYQEMSNRIMEYHEKYKQNQELYSSKMKLRDALYAIMKGVFPYCGLYVVGSSMNGFGNASSDMDLCLMLSHAQVDQKQEATEILRILYKALKKCTFLKEINLIKAKVPILKFRDKISNVECDLNINNSVGIRNTHLLNAYAKLDWRVAPLVMYIKYWARQHNINDAKEGTVSSYSLAMMILHYLQCGARPAVLPCLQQKYPHKFNANVDVRLLTLNDKIPDYQSANTQSLGELFIGFLHYYTQMFNFNEDAMSVRLGKRMRKDVIKWQSPNVPSNQWKCLCIEEPFDLSNTARSVYDHHKFMGVMRVFRASYQRLRNTGDLSQIIDVPL